MKRPIVILVFVLCCWNDPQPARAELRSDEPRVEIGGVKAGRPLSHRFTFVNAGNETIEITTVQPSCGCLKARLPEKRLKPGETGVLVLDVNTLTSPAGPNSWRVQLFYTDKGQPRDLTLLLCAIVAKEIEVQPAALVLHTATTVGSEVTLTDLRPTPLEIKDTRTSSTFLRVEKSERVRDEQGHWKQTLRVDVLAGCPPGRHDETLQVFTTDPDYPELRLPITVIKQSRSTVTTTPAEVTLSAAAGQAAQARIVLLRGVDEQRVEIGKVECDEPAVRCSWAKGPGSMSTLKVRVDPGQIPPSGHLRTNVHILLSQPAGATVDLPVAFAVSGQKP